LWFKVLGLGPKLNSEDLNESNHLDEEKDEDIKIMTK
jgi:hypothetical protein